MSREGILPPRHAHAILQSSAEYFGLSVESLTSNVRAHDVARARHLAMDALRALTGLSHPALGRMFRCDQSTVQLALATIDERKNTDPTLVRDADAVRARALFAADQVDRDLLTCPPNAGVIPLHMRARIPCEQHAALATALEVVARTYDADPSTLMKRSSALRNARRDIAVLADHLGAPSNDIGRVLRVPECEVVNIIASARRTMQHDSGAKAWAMRMQRVGDQALSNLTLRAVAPVIPLPQTRASCVEIGQQFAMKRVESPAGLPRLIAPRPPRSASVRKVAPAREMSSNPDTPDQAPSLAWRTQAIASALAPEFRVSPTDLIAGKAPTLARWTLYYLMRKVLGASPEAIAHETNTPVTSAVTYGCAVMRDRMIADPKVRIRLAALQDAASSALDLPLTNTPKVDVQPSVASYRGREMRPRPGAAPKNTLAEHISPRVLGRCELVRNGIPEHVALAAIAECIARSYNIDPVRLLQSHRAGHAAKRDFVFVARQLLGTPVQSFNRIMSHGYAQHTLRSTAQELQDAPHLARHLERMTMLSQMYLEERVVPPVLRVTQQPQVGRVIDLVSQRFAIAQHDIASGQRYAAHPRQIAMFLLRETTDMSFPAIARAVGLKDHTSAMNALESIGQSAQRDESMRMVLAEMRSALTPAVLRVPPANAYAFPLTHAPIPAMRDRAPRLALA